MIHSKNDYRSSQDITVETLEFSPLRKSDQIIHNEHPDDNRPTKFAILVTPKLQNSKKSDSVSIK